MAREIRPSYNTADVFAAAAAAHRVNGGYLKYTETNDEHLTSKVANKVLIHSFLKGDFDIREQDREVGEKVMQHCRSLTFKLLTDKSLSEFEQNMLTIVEKETTDSNYEISIVSSLPASYERTQIRNTMEVRLRETECLDGQVGDKVAVSAEVVKCYFSDTWGTNFVTAITDDNKQVFFAYRNKLEVGSNFTAEGKIKSQRDNSTQLNYVKMI
jgi:hypothetical protein